jgi:mannose-1-phosphate guanylyltransferase
MYSWKLDATDGSPWVAVLAASNSRRPDSELPTQYRSLKGVPASLVQEALHRASAITIRQRLRAIVSASHRRWWEHPLWFLPASNVVVQPEQLPEASGILLTLLLIVERDPTARIVLLPSTHYVRDEAIFTRALRDVAAEATRRPEQILTLGVEPEADDTVRPYILRGGKDGNVFEVVQRFDWSLAEINRHRAGRRVLWATGILAGPAHILLRSFEQHAPDLLVRMRAAMHGGTRGGADAFAAIGLSEARSAFEFFQSLRAAHEGNVRVMAVPQCGWRDLSVPERVEPVPNRQLAALMRPA